MWRILADGADPPRGGCHRFRQLAEAGGEASLKAAAALYRSDLLAGLDYRWVEGPRARFRNQYLDVLRKLAELYTVSGRHGDALEPLQLLIQTDPLAEDGHVALMAAYAALGNRNAALQQYRTLQRILDDELGLIPGPAAQEIYRRLIE